jgi:hypothetical protein
MEASGGASIEDLIRAAIALRCEEAFRDLFAPPPARSLDELLSLRKSPRGVTLAPSVRSRSSSTGGEGQSMADPVAWIAMAPEGRRESRSIAQANRLISKSARMNGTPQQCG